MPARAVDASAIAALVHAEPGSEEIAESLAGATLIAAALLPHELDSVCAKKTRVNPRDRRRLLEARLLADELGITLLEVDHAGVIELALETGLTAYDSAYLWLALDRGVDLVTLDAHLARHAARARTSR